MKMMSLSREQGYSGALSLHPGEQNDHQLQKAGVVPSSRASEPFATDLQGLVRTGTLEGLFVAELALLQPTAGYMRLV
jgi:hypothetical protein